MRTRLNLYIFSRILKNNVHPGKLHCFFFVVVLFLFLFFFSPDLSIAKWWNFYYLLTYFRHCDIFAKNRSRMMTVIIRPNDKSTLDVLTHKGKNGTKFKKRGPPIRTKPRSSLWLKFLTFIFAGNTDKGSFGRTSCIQRKENTAIHGRIRKLFLYLISKN